MTKDISGETLSRPDQSCRMLLSGAQLVDATSVDPNPAVTICDGLLAARSHLSVPGQFFGAGRLEFIERHFSVLPCMREDDIFRLFGQELV